MSAKPKLSIPTEAESEAYIKRASHYLLRGFATALMAHDQAAGNTERMKAASAQTEKLKQSAQNFVRLRMEAHNTLRNAVNHLRSSAA